jgi:hypothetical protein
MLAMLKCTAQERMVLKFYWFQQYPGKGLPSLMLIQFRQKEQEDKNVKNFVERS